jgi:mono/diheme cytochrome c family protein
VDAVFFVSVAGTIALHGDSGGTVDLSNATEIRSAGIVPIFVRSRGILLTLLLGATFLVPGSALAQTGIAAGPSKSEIERGELEFRLYCAQCHGMSGIGNGPVAPALKTPPANLQLLTKDHGGVFPAQEIRDFIDGTKEMAAHGNREMPIWGLAFQYRGSAVGDTHAPPPASEAEVDRRIERLVDYIRTIQAN